MPTGAGPSLGPPLGGGRDLRDEVKSKAGEPMEGVRDTLSEPVDPGSADMLEVIGTPGSSPVWFLPIVPVVSVANGARACSHLFFVSAKGSIHSRRSPRWGMSIRHVVRGMARELVNFCIRSCGECGQWRQSLFALIFRLRQGVHP